MTTQTSRRLARLLALHERTQAAHMLHQATTVAAASARYEALEAGIPQEPEPPHEECPTSFVNAFNETVHISTENIHIHGCARRVRDDPSWADMGDEDWRQAHRELADAVDRREAVLAEQAKRRIAADNKAYTDSGLMAATDRSETFEDRRERLWRAILETPAASVVDIAAKLRVLYPFNGVIDAEEFDYFKADVQRVAEAAA